MLCPFHRNGERLVSKAVGACSECVRNGSIEQAMRTHEKLRLRDGLVPSVPSDGKTVCAECGNHCQMDEGDVGFCNIRIVEDGQIADRYPGAAVVSWYFDPLPTNCVADWVCSVSKDRDIGFGTQKLNNLAVFYGSCNSDCLYCQNASYRTMMSRGSPLMTAEELADVADDRTACVCYFGGDPGCNAEHSLETSRILNEFRQVKVCYETNGNISKKWLSKIADVVDVTGGTLKFDLKAVNPQIYRALTGVSNKVVIKNFRELAVSKMEREGEFLVASILLVPGYIDIPEIRSICEFIASADPTIPTALLGYAPHFVMSDLPRTSIAHAKTALDVANDVGLINVRIGNRGLLGHSSYKFD